LEAQNTSGIEGLPEESSQGSQYHQKERSTGEYLTCTVQNNTAKRKKHHQLYAEIETQNARTTIEKEYIQNRNFNSIIDRMVTTIFRHCQRNKRQEIRN
jgi:predicted Ser/Thr protein kinase